MSITCDSQVIKVKYSKNFLHGNLNDIKNGFMLITFVKGKILSWVFKNEKYMWMVGGTLKNRNKFSQVIEMFCILTVIGMYVLKLVESCA